MNNQRLRVLHIIKSLGRGGAEVLLAETLKAHNRDQFEFHYIYFLPWKNQVVQALTDAGGHVTCMEADNNFGLILQYAKVRDYVIIHQIDLVHCHLPWAGFLGRLLFFFQKVPVIYTEHNKQERYHFLTRLLNRLTFRFQSVVIAVSADVANSISKNIGRACEVCEIPNGVDVDSFKRDQTIGDVKRLELRIPPDAIVVGIVTVFRTQKRLMEWLNVFAATRENIHGIILGDGPLKEEVVAERKRLGLENLVHLPGLQHNVVPWMSAMDVFMMTSEFEGMPVALLEAMSCSCAVCVTDAGGIKQIVRDGENGLMVPVDEWQKLVDALTRFVRDEPFRRKLAENGRRTVVAKFSMSAMVSELEALYMKRSSKSGKA